MILKSPYLSLTTAQRYNSERFKKLEALVKSLEERIKVLEGERGTAPPQDCIVCGQRYHTGNCW